MLVSHIVAIGQNNEIGQKGGLIWHVPADLKNFKKITTGHHILMGRKTYESIGRPLPNRTSLVVSRKYINTHQESENLIYHPTIEDAIKWGNDNNEKELFIIGGQTLYEQTFPSVDRIYLTRIEGKSDQADCFYPQIDPSKWSVLDSQSYPAVEGKHPNWKFEILVRNKE